MDAGHLGDQGGSSIRGADVSPREPGFTWVLIAALLAVGCPGPRSARETCAAACSRLAEMRCQEAEPTRRGTTCAEVCENAASEGIDIAGRGCVESAGSCDAARRCGR